MTKLANVLMGLVLVAMGVLGITGLMPTFQSNPAYLNIGEIILGGLGLIVGVYSHRTGKQERVAKDLAKQTKANNTQHKQDYDQLKRENDQGKQENADRQRQENEQLKKQNERQKLENEQQKLKNAQQKQEIDQQKQSLNS